MHPQGSDVAHMYMIYIWSSSCLCVWKCVHAYTYICTHAYTYIECDVRPCTCPHTHTHTHIHTHTFSLSLSLSLSLWKGATTPLILLSEIYYIFLKISPQDVLEKQIGKKIRMCLKKKRLVQIFSLSRDQAWVTALICFQSFVFHQGTTTL